MQWQSAVVGGDSPAAREFHTLSALSDGRVLLFGGMPTLARLVSRNHFGDFAMVVMLRMNPPELG